MERNEIFEKLKQILSLAGGETIEDLTEETRLAQDLGLNSVNVLYLVIAIEEMFGFEFDDVGINTFQTVGDVIDYIQRKLP